MKVELIAHTPNPDRTCAEAAYSTVSKEGASELDLSDEKANKILKKVIKAGHHSVVEHAQFTFSLEGLSRACTHQLVRHRIASYSQQSQRYIKFDKIEVVIPDSIKDENKKEFERVVKEIGTAYKKLCDNGVSPEDARYLLPNAAKTNIVMSMNARSLLNFFNLRCCLRAQWEIQRLANKMLNEAKKAAPTIFENAGPSCKYLGYCPDEHTGCPLYPK